MNTLRLILVRRRNDLDNLIAGKLELWDIRGAAMHQVRIQDAENGLVRNNQEVVLLALELQNDGLEADG